MLLLIFDKYKFSLYRRGGYISTSNRKTALFCVFYRFSICHLLHNSKIGVNFAYRFSDSVLLKYLSHPRRATSRATFSRCTEPPTRCAERYRVTARNAAYIAPYNLNSIKL